MTTPAPTTWQEGRFTARRADATADALSPLADDTEDRVVIETDVELPESRVGVADPWITTTDAITGLTIEVRRASCGAGCRCAMEVRVPANQEV